MLLLVQAALGGELDGWAGHPWGWEAPGAAVTSRPADPVMVLGVPATNGTATYFRGRLAQVEFYVPPDADAVLGQIRALAGDPTWDADQVVATFHTDATHIAVVRGIGSTRVMLTSGAELAACRAALVDLCTLGQVVVHPGTGALLKAQEAHDARVEQATERARLERQVVGACARPFYTGACKRAKSALDAYDVEHQ